MITGYSQRMTRETHTGSKQDSDAKHMSFAGTWGKRRKRA